MHFFLEPNRSNRDRSVCVRERERLPEEAKEQTARDTQRGEARVFKALNPKFD
jgi:hypothetical protein